MTRAVPFDPSNHPEAAAESLIGGAIPHAWPEQWAPGAANPYASDEPQFWSWERGRRMFLTARDEPHSAQGERWRHEFDGMGVDADRAGQGEDEPASDGALRLAARSQPAAEQPTPVAESPEPQPILAQTQTGQTSHSGLDEQADEDTNARLSQLRIRMTARSPRSAPARSGRRRRAPMTGAAEQGE
jgi:hypothetical protein